MSPLPADSSMSLHLKTKNKTKQEFKSEHNFKSREASGEASDSDSDSEKQLWGSTCRSRFGAQTRARFRACMLVWVLNVARWAKCLVRNSRVLKTVKKGACRLDL